MKIEALRLFNVKRFADRGVAIEGIGDGVNVLCAANEFGKSTSFEALHALFFQPNTGTPGDVQRLRPYSGGSPLVEADVASAEGRFRITKQFYGGRFARVVDLVTGRLMAQADEAENFIAALIGGGASGPAGLLWVRQGVTGVERRSKSEEDGEKQIRAGLLESVQGEVEAVTGGRRMAAVIAAAQEALAELVTATGRPKAGGRYAAAIEARDGLRETEKKLSADVAFLRRALDERATAVRRLKELERPEDRLERREAVERASARLDAAKARSETLKAAEVELTLARERREAAELRLKDVRTAAGRAEELRTKLRDAELGRAEAAGRRQGAIDALKAARDESDAAEASAQAARELVDRIQAASTARQASERLSELRKRLGEAEAARQEIETGEATFAGIAIELKDVEELQTMELEIARLRAVAQAARPSVTIAYESAAVPRVTMDGAPLDDGEERGYDDTAQLVAPGLGVVTLRSNRPAAGDGRLEKAEARRRALLERLGVADLAAARARQRQAQELSAEMKAAGGRLSLLAPAGLKALRADVAGIGAIDPDALELKADPDRARSAAAAAEERRRQGREGVREAEPLRERAGEAYVAAETALAALAAESAQIEAILGAEDARDELLKSALAALETAERRRADADAAAARLRAGAGDLESAEAAHKRALSAENAAEQEAAGLRETVAGLNAEIRARADEAVEEKWRETVDALAAASVRTDAYEREVALLQRLLAALATARAQARDLYLKPVMTELRPLLGLLFDDVAITFDDRTLLPHKILRNGQEEEVERLSGGMREQLSVLTRLAFARLLARDGRPAPVILDDALVYSDDDRIERMFDALHRQARDQQIIVFSCRQRAFARLGGNVLATRDWRPSGGA